MHLNLEFVSSFDIRIPDFSLERPAWERTVKTDEILGRLPHAFPFRMIDRILQIEPGKKAMAIKNVSFDEPFVQGHFLNEPVMPIVLILEAMAQTGGIAFHSLSENGEGGMPF